MTVDSPAAIALARADWQPFLFETPQRADLIARSAAWPARDVRVRVHRNHAIEPVISVTGPYGAWNGLRYEWIVGEYDDTLTFDLSRDADVDVIWLDLSRYPSLSADERIEWVAERLAHLRARSTLPIVVVALSLSPSERDALAGRLPTGAHVPDLDALEQTLGSGWFDPRTAAISGTRLSNRACIVVARALASRWLPACVVPPIKAIAVDLDGTLYDGVLGEDGVDGVRMSAAHRALQDALVNLRREGMLLALLSRNERADVDALFAARSDFPLRAADFSAVDVSWGDKGAALVRVATQLRIAQDAVVFVDDNPGELATAGAATSVVTVHARPDARATLVALQHVAGVFRWHGSAEDALRADDLRASQTREILARAHVSDEEYLRSLAVRLEFFVGSREHLARTADLVRKTNQFNLPLRRLNEVEIEQRLRQDPRNVVAVRLSDRLSDSGVVAVVVGQVDGGVLQVEELAISCRALGRRLEDTLITRALTSMAEGRAVREVRFDVSRGPRNAPARDWLAAYAPGHASYDGPAVIVPIADLHRRRVSDAVTIVAPIVAPSGEVVA